MCVRARSPACRPACLDCFGDRLMCDAPQMCDISGAEKRPCWILSLKRPLDVRLYESDESGLYDGCRSICHWSSENPVDIMICNGAIYISVYCIPLCLALI